ncbi:MAG: cation:proton antiporter, partial [Solirubrobacterales bacterium]|nr:cation:proton antiporter [Solirubrobacterales bacterium]
MAEIGIIAAVLFAYSLVSDKLSGWAITPPMVFVAAGVLLGPDVLGVFDLTLTGETGLALAEIALVIVLFADAARIDLRALSGNRNLPVRLLGIGMPLTIILGVLIGAVLLKEVEFWEAAIVAAILAPTDAALGQAVVSSQKVPQRIRQALNVESGLNDG